MENKAELSRSYRLARFLPKYILKTKDVDLIGAKLC